MKEYTTYARKCLINSVIYNLNNMKTDKKDLMNIKEV